MRRTILSALLAGLVSSLVTPVPAAAATGLRVQYHTYATTSGNQLAPLVSVVNGGSSTVTLSSLTVRYWFTKDGAQAQRYWCDWTPRGCGNVQARFVSLPAPVARADTYLELAFTSGAGSLAPGASTGDIQGRVAKSDWSSYDQSNDWSFDPTRSGQAADWDHVTLYADGVLVWGVEPIGSAPTDTQAPTAPTSLAASGVTSSGATLSWTASTDNVGVVAYDVYNGSARLQTSTSPVATLSGLGAGTTYTLTVVARDAAGNVSPSSNAVTFTTVPQQLTDTQRPTAPTSVAASAITSSGATLSWTASTDDVGVVAYDVYNNGTRVVTSTTATATLSGLAASTTYTLTVVARDAAGNVSPSSNAVTFSTQAASAFELLWQDDFNSFDSSRWQLMTHSWDGNLAQFSTANTRFQSGILSILLTGASGDAAKPFRGVEMRSLSTLTYGKIETRARYAKGSGVVSGTVLIYTPWPADNWNELDIEYLGAFADRIQFNSQVYMGAPVQPPVTVSVTPTQFPQTASLGFDASADFHVYGIEWTPSGVKYTVDGATRATWSSQIGRMTLPQNILLTIWASSSSSWAGPIQSNSAPTSADFDWIKVYRYRP